MQETSEGTPVCEPERGPIPLGVKICIATVVAVALLCFALIGAAVFNKASRQRARQAAPGPYAHLDGTSEGNPDATIRLLAILPLRTACHVESIEYLLAVCNAAPDRFHVRFLDRRLPHGEKELKRLGLTCASVVHDGRNRYELPDGRTVRLQGGPGDGYTMEDLRRVLQMLADRAYGEGTVALPEVSPPADS